MATASNGPNTLRFDRVYSSCAKIQLPAENIPALIGILLLFWLSALPCTHAQPAPFSPLRTNAGNIQSHLVETASSTQVQRLAVVAPGHVVWMLRSDYRSQVLSFRRNDPQTTRAGHVQVAALIDLHAIERIF